MVQSIALYIHATLMALTIKKWSSMSISITQFMN
jgi:hypothetical protein